MFSERVSFLFMGGLGFFCVFRFLNMRFVFGFYVLVISSIEVFFEDVGEIILDFLLDSLFGRCKDEFCIVVGLNSIIGRVSDVIDYCFGLRCISSR